MSFDQRQILLTGVDGSVWDLTSGAQGVVAEPDSRLWGSASLEVATVRTIGTAGARIVGTEYPPRDLALPVHLMGDIGSALDETAHRFARAINCKNGEITITVVRGDGVSRSIDVIVMDGFDGLALTTCYANDMPAVLSLRAHQPFWYRTDQPTATFDPPDTAWNDSLGVDWDATDVEWDSFAVDWDSAQAANGAVDWDDPNTDWDAFDTPWDGWTDLIVQTLPNDGDVEGWPIWEITGPAGIVFAERLDTGQIWRLTDGLQAGETMTVNTRTGIVRINGELALPRLDLRDLWAVPDGGVEMAIMHTGRGPGSSFHVSYDVRYLTP